jgi:hypothetical protein
VAHLYYIHLSALRLRNNPLHLDLKVDVMPLGKINWRPAWDIEGRSPSWTSAAAATALHNPFGGDKYLWGNMPAFDILQLEENEGAEYDVDISLLVAGMYSLFFIFLYLSQSISADLVHQ